MSKPDHGVRFVQMLMKVGQGIADSEGVYCVTHGHRSVRLSVSLAKSLGAHGVLVFTAGTCRPTPEAKSWLRRQLTSMPEDLSYSAQHRRISHKAGLAVNTVSSPLLRLAQGGADKAFLERHHIEAGERVARWVERACIRSRVTMSYSSTHMAHSGAGKAHGAELGDMALDARRALTDIYKVLPPECADVVMDVCGFEKSLQLIESERGWPRRSAKLVLRIGLTQLAGHFGLSAIAEGQVVQSDHHWLAEGARPTDFA